MPTTDDTYSLQNNSLKPLSTTKKQKIYTIPQHICHCDVANNAWGIYLYHYRVVKLLLFPSSGRWDRFLLENPFPCDWLSQRMAFAIGIFKATAFAWWWGTLRDWRGFYRKLIGCRVFDAFSTFCTQKVKNIASYYAYLLGNMNKTSL